MLDGDEWYITSKYNRAYYLIRTYWYSLSSGYVKHASVGPAGIWGTDTKNKVYKYIGGNFTLVNGLSLEQVDPGGDGQVVGVTPSTYYAYCLRDSYSLAYKGTGSRVIPSSCGYSSWRYVSGLSMKMIEVASDGSVFGVSTNGRVYQRTGIYGSRTYGLSWSYVSMQKPISHVTYDLGNLWAVTTSGLLLQCTH
ncbi:fish-egg lectin-like protein [Lates japonicus]|uniref:Fish-egg lectin-like protein n=1 Tax=Lates japonicus TaxID=270547 RepID=A0AAD3M6A5_LATJO|nr:fish-egg lectin-like protein [Lates japonicus]